MVHSSERKMSTGQSKANVANYGLFRPPFIFAISIGLGFLIHWLWWPAQWFPTSASMPVGIFLVLVSVVLFIFATRTFVKASTPVPGNRATTTIVSSGPYGFSRNPIYLAFTLFQIGIAIWVNDLAVLLMLVPALSLMVFVVIPREERYLEKRFPREYPPYKRKVRRWL